MISTIAKKIFGTKHERELKALQPLVNKINDLEPEMQKLSDEELQAKTPEFKQRLEKGETLDAILPEAFAVCREASVRVLGMRHYDVQLIGGITLHRGVVAEMRTGEGKTLVATLPVYLNALSGKGVHVVTVNDYLARRDCAWMGQLYNWLGLTTGTIYHDMSDKERFEAYRADITYATNNELGFDYLRDNMKYDLSEFVQRELNFAIVDECDSILIDEARTPLIISGPSEESTEKYYDVNKIIPGLEADKHFTMEEKTKTVSLTEEGNSRVEELMGIENIYEPQYIQLVHHIYQALKAHHLFKIDVDYMVKDGEIVIVDEFTGRLMPGRRWSDGLHQAIEAKEGIKIKGENQTLASITFQNFFRMYNKLSGMTGTAETEAIEFAKIYSLEVMVIPTNKPIARKDVQDEVYKNEQAKINAMVKDIKERTQKGQPVLVGTVSIEKSEFLSRSLTKLGVKHNVLNAKHHEKEAEIVAQAGRLGAVTIATNMAGRGTDIVLGGNAEFMAKAQHEDETSPEYKATLEKFRKQCEEEKQKVLEAGGLYIVGTERHETRRIDNQLRGRAGRQGDPGESRFYLSLDDNLMRIFNGERIQKIMNTLDVPDDEPITAKMVTRAIENSQKKVEGHNFDIRKHLLEYDDVMNQQRHRIYSLRRDVLRGEDIERMVLDMLGDVTSHILDVFANENNKVETWDLDGMNTALQQQFGIRMEIGDRSRLTAEGLTDMVSSAVKTVYDKQKEHLGEHYVEIARMILLQTIDQRWKDHLLNIDQLKEGINLRAYAQKDPLIEYKKEAFARFEELQSQIQSELIEKLLKIQIVSPEEAQLEMEQQSQNFDNMSYESPEDNAQQFVDNQMPLGAMQPQQQELQYSSGGDGYNQQSDRKLNRAERRRMEKKNKKRR
ncbi:MAG: preprotein translocase subunit SecA [Bdellovibrionaceae bacterium]|nr:preprotein translocase subunit SecA [Pseudobdellovibrionaceae bacterium]|tara:strand:+ start:61829 stop:64516 length:2688 start_codon:yes stop_codon:yes gene_type:complete